MNQLDNVGTEEIFEDWVVEQPTPEFLDYATSTSEVRASIMSVRYIYVWPNAAWCDKSELEEMGCMGDDYRLITVHASMDNDTVGDMAAMAANGASDEALEDEIHYWMGG